MKHLRTFASISFAALLGLAACRDVVAPQTPPPAPPPNALLGIISIPILDPILASIPLLGPLLVPDTVVVVQRLQALPYDITQTKLIGSGGGQISIPAAGVTLIVPYGAVDYATPITMTALAGRGVAYEFGPSGMTFKKPLTIKQDLSVTSIDPRLLSKLKFSGGYFKSRKYLLGGLLGIIYELLSATTSASGTSVQFNVKHFSGYLIAVDFSE
jgi:hypothetical protein